MLKAKLKEGNHLFLGVLHQLTTKTHSDTGVKAYYAVLVTVKNGQAQPQFVLGESQSLVACIRQMKAYLDRGRSLKGAKRTFVPPFTEAFFHRNQLCRLEALSPIDSSRALASLKRN